MRAVVNQVPKNKYFSSLCSSDWVCPLNHQVDLAIFDGILFCKAVSKIKVLTPNLYLKNAWKNGKGTTEQIFIFPEQTSIADNNFYWRISRAEVSESGFFSSFKGYERVLVITKTKSKMGQGVRLEQKEAPNPFITLAPYDPYFFSGEAEMYCELLDGPVSDFNIIYRKDFCKEVKATCVLLTPQNDYKWHCHGTWNFCYVIGNQNNFERSAIRVKYYFDHGSDTAFRVLPESTIVVEATQDSLLLLTADLVESRVIIVSIN